jgi:hypothetical protein
MDKLISSYHNQSFGFPRKTCHNAFSAELAVPAAGCLCLAPAGAGYGSRLPEIPPDLEGGA